MHAGIHCRRTYKDSIGLMQGYMGFVQGYIKTHGDNMGSQGYIM